MLIQTTYPEIRAKLRAGDVIAFSGSGRISRMIQRFTRSGISHVGIVFEILEDDVRRVKLMESTTLSGVAGVQETYLAERCEGYGGPIWWLPLAERNRSEMDMHRFWKALCDQRGKRYDYRQVLHHGWDILKLFSQGEDWRRIYCSELAAIGLKASFVLPMWMNVSEIRPNDLCAFKIYTENYYQISGVAREIRKFNIMNPEDWRNK
jgi:hypothetical protein